MTLRAVEAGDAEALSAIHSQCFDRPWSAADFLEFSSRAGACALLVEAEGAPAGFILCWIVAQEAEVLTLAVLPAARKHGLGRALVAAAIHLCGQEGAEVMWLEVAEDNGAALALYAGCGFEPAGRRRAYYGRGFDAPPVDAIVLRRTLDGGA